MSARFTIEIRHSGERQWQWQWHCMVSIRRADICILANGRKLATRKTSLYPTAINCALFNCYLLQCVPSKHWQANFHLEIPSAFSQSSQHYKASVIATIFCVPNFQPLPKQPRKNLSHENVFGGHVKTNRVYVALCTAQWLPAAVVTAVCQLAAFK